MVSKNASLKNSSLKNAYVSVREMFNSDFERFKVFARKMMWSRNVLINSESAFRRECKEVKKEWLERRTSIKPDMLNFYRFYFEREYKRIRFDEELRIVYERDTEEFMKRVDEAFPS
jgi:hypothetical protein